MAFDIFISNNCRQRGYRSVLVFWCCVISYHKLGSFRTMSDYLRALKAGSLGHRVSQGWNQGFRGQISYLGKDLLPNSFLLLVEFASSRWWMASLHFFAGSPPGALSAFRDHLPLLSCGLSQLQSQCRRIAFTPKHSWISNSFTRKSLISFKGTFH